MDLVNWVRKEVVAVEMRLETVVVGEGVGEWMEAARYVYQFKCTGQRP